MITLNQIEKIQSKWAKGIVTIGSLRGDKNAVETATDLMINELYAFDLGDVLFKPTLVSDIQFRNTKESALSYFIGNNDNFSEDSGFALKPWTKIRWENSGIQLFQNIATAMGNYYFTKDDVELKVEFSFVFKKDDDGILRIILHDSHLPYQK